MPAPRLVEERKCVVCGTPFTVDVYVSHLKHRALKHCSKSCSNRGRTKTLAERFARYIGETTDSGCILWTGSRAAHGYGHIGGTVDGRRTMLLAHRVAWELANGPIPDGLQILHRCDNPPCINVDHLFLGTHMDNHVDKAQKGRGPRGEKNPKAKLAAHHVREIRKRYASATVTQLQLAKEYHVHLSTIERIVAKTSWGHIDG